MPPASISITHTATIEATTLAMREHWCVYSHHAFGELFYIGLCKMRDVFDAPDAIKNNHWRDHITDETPIKLTIVFSSIILSDCNKLHAQLIEQYKPRANKLGWITTGPVVISCVSGPHAGKTWRSQVEAARALGFNQPTLSNHLNGIAGYETVKGMKFKRGMP
jgi:hypothetical protein